MMNEFETFDFLPADTLFCRDQRPLAAGSGYGHGANWPPPTVLHSTLRTALLRKLDGPLPNGKTAGYKRYGQERGKIGSALFNWLHTRGPFPVKEGNLYFPRPLDLAPAWDQHSQENSEETRGVSAERLKVIAKPTGKSDLPATLSHIVASYSKPSKEKLPAWISDQEYKEYLIGIQDRLIMRENHLTDTEHRIGVEIECESHTAAAGQLYASEHLRLREDVRLRFCVSRPPKHKPRVADEADIIPSDLDGQIVTLGGESRFGRIHHCAADDALALPTVDIHGKWIKWVLLTPAIFSHGWRPGWIDEKGWVKLRVIDKDKRREGRRQRRDNPDYRYDESRDDAAEIKAQLKAVCIGKPRVVGGWDVLAESEDGKQKGGKATHLAVPSGSVYYFEANDAGQARNLANALQGRCRSDFFGEKGMGLGVCGVWREGKPFHV